MIALPVLAIAAVLYASYLATRWAYGAMIRMPVGSGNNASFRPEAAAQATGNDVRGYLELNLVKVEDKKVESDTREKNAERAKEKEGQTTSPANFLSER